MSQFFTSGGQSVGVSASASSPSNEHPGLISFRMDWLDLLAVQGTLKSLLQHHSSKASILQHSAFFIVQLSHPHMTTGKTIALTRQTPDTFKYHLYFDNSHICISILVSSLELQSFIYSCQFKLSTGVSNRCLYKSKLGISPGHDPFPPMFF